MPVKIYSPEDFILDFIKNFSDNSDKIIKKGTKNLIKLKNGKYFEIKEAKFNPHGPDGDWTEFTEKNRLAYEEAIIDLKNGNVVNFNSIDEFKKRYS